MEPLTVPGTLDALDPIADFVMAAVKQAGIEKKAGYRLRLAVDEIATNIVIHGYEETGLNGDIVISGEIDDDTLTIILEDHAMAYNPLDRPEVSEEELTKPLEDRAIGGLGVFLTLRGVDRFSYEYIDDTNRNIFMMKRPKGDLA
jgi:serine/threonine-protein kinase RsbW